MSNDMFRALVVTEVEKNRFERELVERRIDDLPEGEVLIRVEYSALNYKDALSATGHKGVTRKFPHTPGIDAAGTVSESSNPGFRVGEKVLVTGYDLGMNTAGGFGQYIRVPAGWVVKLPETMSLKGSMIYGTAGFTAGLSLYKMEQAGLSPDMGEVLVTGAAGGVGSMALAILAQAGYRPTAATGRTHEKDYLTRLGAVNVIHRDDINDTSSRPLLKGRWAGAIDTVGGNFLSTVLKSVSNNGSVACCGLVASPEFSATVFPFILRGINLLGIESAECPMDVRMKVWKKLADQWRVNDVEYMARETSLDNLDDDIHNILKGATRGRVIVNLAWK